MNNIFRFGVVLFVVNFIAASVLAGVYYITKPRIDAQESLLREEALKEVMPESVGERLEAVEEDGKIRYWNVYKGFDSTRPSGYIFIAKRYGYSSVIESMVGIKRDGTITGVRILSQNETPGLGAKIVEVASYKTIAKALKGIFTKEREEEKTALPYFTEQFKGLDVRRVELSRLGIEAITGATISSKAVVESIKERGSEILNAK